MITYEKNGRTFHKIEIGDIFGRLTVIKKGNGLVDKTGHKFGTWVCQCSCENETIVEIRTTSLTMGSTQSCGCLQREKFPNHNFDSVTNQFKSKYGNTYDLTGEYGKGYTTTGDEFLFDLEDYDLIKQYIWNTKKDSRNKEDSAYWYAVSGNQNNERVWMHRLVTHCPPDKVVDHFNHKTLDNRKENLRVCERAENSQSQRLRPDNTSGHKGVYWDKSRNKWMANIMAFGQYHYLGRYEKYEDAVAAREAAEEKYFKEFNYKPQEINKNN